MSDKWHVHLASGVSVHAYIHTYIHTCLHTYRRTYVHTSMCVHLVCSCVIAPVCVSVPSVQRRMNSVLLIDTATEAREFMFNRCPRGYNTAYTLEGSRVTSDGGFYSGPWRNKAVYLQTSNEETVRYVCMG